MRTPVNQELIKSYHQFNTKNVPLSVFLMRVNNLRWDVKRAGETPYVPRTGGLVAQYKELYDRIESPTVGFDVFCRRMRNGRDVEEAAKAPKIEPSELYSYYHQYQDKPAVGYTTFFNRVVSLNWERIKAITTPPTRKMKPRKEVRSNTYLAMWFNKNIERAKVDWSCFSQRVFKGGWDKERALTTPSMAENESQLRAFYNQHPDCPVNYMTFHRRVYALGWDMQRAISTPVRDNTRSPRERVVVGSKHSKYN